MSSKAYNDNNGKPKNDYRERDKQMQTTEGHLTSSSWSRSKRFASGCGFGGGVVVART